MDHFDDGVEIFKGAVSKRHEGKTSLVQSLNAIHSELNDSFYLYLEYNKGSRKKQVAVGPSPETSKTSSKWSLAYLIVV